MLLKVPSIGESIREATVGVWKKGEGDWVDVDEPLVEVESEKATLEVPSPGSGILKKILHAQGDSVTIGEALAEIEESAARPAAGAGAKGRGAATAPANSNAGGSTPAPSPAAPPSPPPAAAVAPATPAPPSARRLMVEAGLASEDVRGTGRGGRISAADVARTLDERRGAPAAATARETGARPAASLPPAAAPGVHERIVPMTTLRKTIARRLVEAQQTAAILTTFNEVDMSGVMALRERHQERFTKQHGVKLGFMSFFVKAAIEGLKAFPSVNAEVRGTDIIYKDHYDIGVAVGGGKGLVVPVVRDADRLSFADLEKTVGGLAVKARDNKLQIADLEGGTFTISNGGVYGSLMSTPILNPPQSGILGLHAINKRAVVVDDQVVVRPMMFVALSYDHRIVDGREAVQFLVRIKDCVESPERLLLEV